MADDERLSPVFFAVSNIPVVFRSADLRNYFSQFIESGGFQCFHYRHRPEILRECTENTADSIDKSDQVNASSSSSQTDRHSEEDSGVKEQKQPAKSCCCIVLVHHEKAEPFLKMYSGNHWIDSKGTWLKKRCVIKRIKVNDDEGNETSVIS